MLKDSVLRIQVGVLLLALLATGCGSDPPIPDIHGDGIEDIHFGILYPDLTDQVGFPDQAGILDGTHRAWFSARYSDSIMAGVTFNFEESVVRPIDEWPFDSYQILYPYKGSGKDGIVIGSSKEELFQAYGNPIDPGAERWFLYCRDGKSFQYLITEDTLRSIIVGYNTPLPEISKCEPS